MLPHLAPVFVIRAIALLTHTVLVAKCPAVLVCKHTVRLAAWQHLHSKIGELAPTSARQMSQARTPLSLFYIDLITFPQMFPCFTHNIGDIIPAVTHLSSRRIDIFREPFYNLFIPFSAFYALCGAPLIITAEIRHRYFACGGLYKWICGRIHPSSQFHHPQSTLQSTDPVVSAPSCPKCCSLPSIVWSPVTILPCLSR